MTLILNGTDNSATTPAVQGGTAGTTTGVYYPTTNQVAIATNGTQAMLVDSSQNVGIGTGSPGNRLHLYKANGSENKLIIENASTSQSSTLSLITQAATPGGCYIYMGKSGATTNGQIVYDPNIDAMELFTGNTERVRIDSSGNVNIKTSNAGIVFNNSSALTNSTLNDYETGTWTPTNGVTALTTTSGQVPKYTKIGNIVIAYCDVTVPSSNVIGGLPFTAFNQINPGNAYIGYTSYASFIGAVVASGSTNTNWYTLGGSGASFSSTRVCCTIVYQASF